MVTVWVQGMEPAKVLDLVTALDLAMAPVLVMALAEHNLRCPLERGPIDSPIPTYLSFSCYLLKRTGLMLTQYYSIDYSFAYFPFFIIIMIGRVVVNMA